ncbi:PcfJ domain-containing protein [Rhizobium sp. BK176]|uniref:PcfJ domain-containing protein n=1 Tax=Rhizobium sp. BK176 TaxID=2587071 RepID=UPI00216749AE|nr:PcfJ domain-containing protein [Rhizobium sp. BK176]MCS4090238.1 hypothetical protein [Rhizobium sp. BK176]
MSAKMEESEQRIARMKDYLLGVVNGDKVIAELLFYCVGRVELRSGADLKTRQMTEALDMLSEVIHIADWLRVCVNENATWLKNVDEQDRPKKLLKFGTMASITAEADRFFRRRRSSNPNEIKISKRDEELHFDLGDGWWLVKLLTATALDRESQLMQHCIGQGAYDKRLADEHASFLSLRDPFGMPHATLEIYKDAVVQFQGKQNASPIPKYVARCLPYFQSGQFAGLPKNVIKDVDGVVHTIYDLPEVLRVDGRIHIDDTVENLRLPNVIEATGSIQLGGRPCENTPKSVKAGGNLIIEGVVLDRLPDELSVAGDISLRGSIISKLPENLTVSGGLYLDRSAITQLPRGLTVRGLLGLAQTSVDHLPVDLRCSSIDISFTSIDRFDTAVFLADDGQQNSRSLKACSSALTEIVGEPRFWDIDLAGSQFTRLPDNLRVNSQLNISNTAIAEIQGTIEVFSITGKDCAGLHIGLSEIAGSLDLTNSHVSMPETFSCLSAFLRGVTFVAAPRINAMDRIVFADGPIPDLNATTVDFRPRQDTRIEGNISAYYLEVASDVDFLGENVNAKSVKVGWAAPISLSDTRELILKEGSLRSALSGFTTGPTGILGSGTLQRAIQSMSRTGQEGRNIVTIEDPPEYFVPFVDVAGQADRRR